MGRLGENSLEVKCTVKEVYFIMHIQWLCCYIYIYIYIYIYTYTYIYLYHILYLSRRIIACNITKDIIFTDCNLFFFFFSIFKLLGLKLSAYLCVIIITRVMSIFCM